MTRGKNPSGSIFFYYLLRLMRIEAHLMRIEKSGTWPLLIVTRWRKLHKENRIDMLIKIINDNK